MLGTGVGYGSIPNLVTSNSCRYRDGCLYLRLFLQHLRVSNMCTWSVQCNHRAILTSPAAMGLDIAIGGCALILNGTAADFATAAVGPHVAAVVASPAGRCCSLPAEAAITVPDLASVDTPDPPGAATIVVGLLCARIHGWTLTPANGKRCLGDRRSSCTNQQ